MYSKEEIGIANKTSRNSGAVGKKAVVPQVIRNEFSPKENLTFLDFGAGKAAAHKLSLEEDGYNVKAYEFGENSIPGIHTPDALLDTYDVIYASNVLNVQSTEMMMVHTLCAIKNSLNPGGIFIANYPTSPRKAGWSVKDVKVYLGIYFNVERIKHNSNVVFKLTVKNK